MSHFAFVNPGGPKVPDLAKAKRYGITRLYWQANDEQVSAGLLQAIRDRRMGVGLMRDPIWGDLTRLEYDAAVAAGHPPTPHTAVDLARTLDADLGVMGFSHGTEPNTCAALADMEIHSVDYIAGFIHEWRALRPTRITGWTLEPRQGGWITKDLAALILGSQVTCFPQTFRGDMSPVDPDSVRSQLIEAGIPRGLVALCYDGAHIPASWDGIAFRFEQMP